MGATRKFGTQRGHRSRAQLGSFHPRLVFCARLVSWKRNQTVLGDERGAMRDSLKSRMYTHRVRGEIGERGLFCVVLGLAVGCFSEPPPVNNDASSEGASTAAMGTEGDAGEGSESATSTQTAGEAGSESNSSGESAGTDSNGTEGTGTGDTGTDGGRTDTGVGTGSGVGCTGTVVYLNFDGVTLTAGPEDDATENISSITFTELIDTPLQPYSSDTAAVINAVSEHVAAFNVCLVTERPAARDFEMIVVTDTEPPINLVTALSAIADCGNSNPSEISFVFGSSGVENVIPAVSSRIGFHIGLENGTDPADIMGPAGSKSPQFLDSCSQLNNPALATCSAQHATHCGAGGQNSFQELLAAFGAAPP